MLPILMAICLASAPADPPSAWAIVIGIDAQDDPAIAASPGAASDANAVRRWLVDVAGWPASHLLTMTPSSPKSHGVPSAQVDELRPSRANLDWALERWLPYRVKPGDLVLISYSGQAVGGKADDSASPDVLLPIDARAADLQRTGWSLPDALDPIAQRGENPILVWLDTSLWGRGRPALPFDGRRTSAARLMAQVTRWPLVSAWIASNDRAIEPLANQRSRGRFLASVTMAMGDADRPANLATALSRLDRDPAVASAGFRLSGGLGPSASLWPKQRDEAVEPASELLLQHGHSDRITAVAFSSDGSRMISASMDSTIRVWRTSDRVLLRTLPAHLIGVTALSLSPDATWLASGDGSGRVLLWSMVDFIPRRAAGPPVHDRGLAKIAFLPDSCNFASLDLGGKVVLWKARAKSIEPTILAPDATAIASGEDGVAVAARWGEETPTIRILDATGAETHRFAGPGGDVFAEALAIRDGRIAAGDRRGNFGIWTISDGSPVKSFTTRPIDAIRLESEVAWVISGRTLAKIPVADAAPSLRLTEAAIE